MIGESDSRSAWAIDSSTFDPNANAFFIASKREVSMREYDKILVFARRATEISFLWHGKITQITRTPEEEPVTFILEVSAVETFEDPRQLEDYAYSLLKVYRYQEPWRHFLRTYVRIDVFDFETIVRGWIFWARTAFGTFANALPNVKLFEYLQLAAEQQPTRVVQGGSMASAWQLLRDFITDEYIAPAGLFAETADTLRELGQDPDMNVVVRQLGVSEDDVRTDPILEQAERFTVLVRSLQEPDDGPVMHQVDGAIEQSRPIEERFEKRFAEVRWPLNVIASS